MKTSKFFATLFAVAMFVSSCTTITDFNDDPAGYDKEKFLSAYEMPDGIQASIEGWTFPREEISPGETIEIEYKYADRTDSFSRTVYSCSSDTCRVVWKVGEGFACPQYQAEYPDTIKISFTEKSVPKILVRK